MVRRGLSAARNLAGGLHHSPDAPALEGDARATSRAPSRPTRLPESEAWQTSADAPAPQEILDATAEQLRSRRWRVRREEFDGTTGWVSAEKGYLRETGNLLFHIALLVLLFAVAIGGMFSWRGQAIVIEGESFTDTITQYDSLKSGQQVNVGELPPFSFTLK